MFRDNDGGESGIAFSRELVRRWYGQVLALPKSVTSDMANFAGYTVIPDLERQTFGNTEFVPTTGLIELVSNTAQDHNGEFIRTVVRGYQGYLNFDDGTVRYGDCGRLLLTRDLSIRPEVGTKGPAFDPSLEMAALGAALDLESEREAAIGYANLTRRPSFPGFFLSFKENDMPSLDLEFDGLKEFTWRSLQPGERPLPVLHAPEGVNGVVSRVVRDRKVYLTLIEVTTEDNKAICIELPGLARPLVKPEQRVRPGKQLAQMSLPSHLSDAVDAVSNTVHHAWVVMCNWFGIERATNLLKFMWQSSIVDWFGLKMVPHLLVPPDFINKATGVWRDLRHYLGRVKHWPRNPIAKARMIPDVGPNFVWPVHSGNISCGGISPNIISV